VKGINYAASITQFSSVSCHFIPVTCEYSLKRPAAVLLSGKERRRGFSGTFMNSGSRGLGAKSLYPYQRVYCCIMNAVKLVNKHVKYATGKCLILRSCMVLWHIKTHLSDRNMLADTSTHIDVLSTHHDLARS
jgi:hypothetical protein